jgi:hypothetical protein
MVSFLLSPQHKRARAAEIKSINLPCIFRSRKQKVKLKKEETLPEELKVKGEESEVK